jgi:hypothetical protein
MANKGGRIASAEGASPGDLVELSGVARAAGGAAEDAGDGGGELLVYSRVTVGDTSDAAEQARAFTVETADGWRVAIRPPEPIEGRLEPHVERRGPWWQLRVPLRDQHRTLAPETHAGVVTAVLRAGDPVTVIGRVVEVAPGAAAGPAYRTAPTRRVVAIAADVVGVGPGAVDAARHAARVMDGAHVAEDAQPWTWAIRLLSAMPLTVVAAATSGRLQRMPTAALTALAWLAVGVVASRGRPPRPSATREIGPGLPVAATWALALCSLAMVVLSGHRPEVSAPPATLTFVLLLTAIVAEAVLTAQAVRIWRGARRFAQRLQPAAGWSVVEARVPSGFSTRTQSDVEVEIGGGARRLVLDGAWIATDEIDDAPGLIGASMSCHALTAGGRVVIAGTFDEADGGDLSSSESAPLVLYGCPTGAPRAHLARRVRAVGLSAIELGVILATSLALAATQLG